VPFLPVFQNDSRGSMARFAIAFLSFTELAPCMRCGGWALVGISNVCRSGRIEYGVLVEDWEMLQSNCSPTSTLKRRGSVHGYLACHSP
jgi:hypothetical protein